MSNSESGYYVHIVRCANGTYYVGSTASVSARLVAGTAWRCFIGTTARADGRQRGRWPR